MDLGFMKKPTVSMSNFQVRVEAKRAAMEGGSYDSAAARFFAHPYNEKTAVPLGKLRVFICRWPVTDKPTLYCGLPVRDASCPYCSGHAARAFTPPHYRGR